MMTGTELFTKAHAIARETRAAFATYRMAFSAALKRMHAMKKEAANPFKAAYDLVTEMEALNAKAREIGHRVHMTGKGGNEMLAVMRELDALNTRRFEMRREIVAAYKVRKLWKDEAAREAAKALFDADPADELSCYA